jgi:Fe2+ transport system protein FeoA
MRLILNKLRPRPARAEIFMLAALQLSPGSVRRSSEQAPQLMLLSELPAGALARVAHVIAHSDDLRRLQALGVCVGRRVQLVKAGDPLIISVVGARVGLSARLAAEVRVIPIAAEDSTFTALANAS